ncbi:GNAT family N-acetyltransferase [Mesorhizobium sp. M2A.F.Ca.ET.037.01.1.1]|uniref:GNAT family N-acetyltransferase n=1 Tax=unclassified Mesorhizobium TaxID=325217 RepID=UPI000F752AFA|nr:MULTISPECIES: GNAT family N-acetyltransferase [unclassified Mesorhizobium]RUV52862.1 GNAT family N-acetyltransferase [Mesorhizobium sp. M7A.F.Ca.MR.228.00.0.0]RVC68717.1 GNAT family N-acetyltransferase [Mesorhizobium sp. M00.F.Ca.ET.038.03.1.1]AZO36015.1 GNAT family N-acetyltransferase [Mesorhizobium sp. M2A.F.Ca.ET.046.03.2.1]AZO73074.1 GNAT family N-acetyltransferase [Mesorhizobium sp. M1D.F.Ca.ET.043.01.1.1]RUV17534.1 GNAT family N-acetyltransferase [Mesorhizobium sp. M7A.F.Ca.MR.245.00.
MSEQSEILYVSEPNLDPAEFCRVLAESGFGATHGELRLHAMLRQADLVLTARLHRPGRKLVGVLRCVTDFSWICYVSELAVSASAQGLGIGKGLLYEARRQLGPAVAIALISTPNSVGFYEGIGLTRISDAFWLMREC